MTEVQNANSQYFTVAASQTDQALESASGLGRTGDFLKHLLVVPATLAAGSISIKDGSTSISVFATGTLSDLKPFVIKIEARSKTGSWKVTTGANVSVVAVGLFS